MTPWLTVWKKDLRMTRTRDLVGILILVIIESMLVYLAYASNNLGYPSLTATGFIAILFFLHVLFLPFHVANSLSQEWRKTSPLWLHIPQPGWSLLLSKFISGLIAMVISLAITCAFAWWIMGIEAHSVPLPIQNELTLYHSDIQTLLTAIRTSTIIFAIFLICQSIYMTVWVSLISIVMQSVKNQLAKARWFIGMLIILIATWGMDAFENTSVYRTLFDWGKLSIPLDLPPAVPIGVLPSVYSGALLFHAAIVIILFYLCGILLDKKVEV